MSAHPRVSEPVTAEVEALKPFDLRNIIRDAFLAGRGLTGDAFLSDEDQAAWAAYEPAPAKAYTRVVAALSRLTSDAHQISSLREEARAATERAEKAERERGELVRVVRLYCEHDKLTDRLKLGALINHPYFAREAAALAKEGK